MEQHDNKGLFFFYSVQETNVVDTCQNGLVEAIQTNIHNTEDIKIQRTPVVTKEFVP